VAQSTNITSDEIFNVKWNGKKDDLVAALNNPNTKIIYWQSNYNLGEND